MTDRRTRAGREAEVIEQVRERGGFSCLWACETQQRAHAIERLQARGAIRRVGGEYPWCSYEIVEASP